MTLHEVKQQQNGYLVQLITVQRVTCEVLICANSARCCGLTNFNFTVTFIPWFQLSHCCMCHSPVSCDLINLCFFTGTSRE